MSDSYFYLKKQLSNVKPALISIAINKACEYRQ